MLGDLLMKTLICWLVGQVTCRGCTITKLPRMFLPMNPFRSVINFQTTCWFSLRQFSVRTDHSAAIAGPPVDCCSSVKGPTRLWMLRMCLELHLTTQWVAWFSSLSLRSYCSSENGAFIMIISFISLLSLSFSVDERQLLSFKCYSLTKIVHCKLC